MIIDSFCGVGARGNRHHIIHLKSTPDSNGSTARNAVISKARTTSLISATENTVLLWQEQQKWCVRFFDGGQPVQRCGSGSIAVAAYLYKAVYQRAFKLPIETALGTITVGHDRYGAYYVDRPCTVTGFDGRARWVRLCQTPVLKAVRMGGRQDYTLLLLPDRQALETLKPPGQALALYSGRSVIALCPTQKHWLLRYFAPQYGVAEDAATGSACVQASAYLAQTTAIRRFDFIQCSQGKGVIHTNAISRHVIVRGDYHSTGNLTTG
ncbi:PhzF family phenazine biosynthesis protein [Gilvimarinus agarilyticus]|uniref:PhzF family phenazine biosynthesis protein n=1 Tax=Gilvimarinus agarilyticus TaxID=679259 RepID=UPI00059FC3AB|nr:PhzF family phenazine biosynthesis protein [Gilvimarinus agarilyticus]